MEYIYKDEIMDMLGLDKNKAGDWKTYFELYEIASDDIILGLPGYTSEDIGFNSPLYSRERKKYKPNEIPTKYKSWEYLSKRMVNLMIMRADTEKARQQRLKLEF